MRVQPSNRISNKALPVWRIKAFLQSLIIAGIPAIYSILVYFYDLPLWILLLLIAFYVIFLVITVFVVPYLQWRRWRYDILEEEVDLERGVFIKKRTLIPMARIQHVDTEQGPLLRKYGLATVTISTAATIHTIPALTMDVALEIRDRISKLATEADENE